jgi:hypothetical protein
MKPKMGFITILLFIFALISLNIYRNSHKSKIPAATTVQIATIHPENTSESTESQKYFDLIQVNNPKPNVLVKNPIILMGKAKGSWFFEGSFPVELVYAPSKGYSIATRAQAEGDWATDDFVEFGVTLDWPPTAEDTGYLILKKDNPSGLAENDAQIKIPIKFR